MNRLLAIVAFAVFAGFLLILVIEVPSLDLILVVGFTAALALIDFVRSLIKKRD